MPQLPKISRAYQVVLQGPAGNRRVGQLFGDLERAQIWARGKLANDQRYSSYDIEELTSSVYAGPPPHGASVLTHSWHGDALSFGRLS